MRATKTFQPDKCLSSDKNNPNFSKVHYNKITGVLSACNGTAAVSRELSDEDQKTMNHTGLVDPVIFSESRKGLKKKADPRYISIDAGEVILETSTGKLSSTLEEPTEYQDPTNEFDDHKDTIDIGINVNDLKAICAVFGGNKLVLSIKVDKGKLDTNYPMKVKTILHSNFNEDTDKALVRAVPLQQKQSVYIENIVPVE